MNFGQISQEIADSNEKTLVALVAALSEEKRTLGSLQLQLSSARATMETREKTKEMLALSEDIKDTQNAIMELEQTISLLKPASAPAATPSTASASCLSAASPSTFKIPTNLPPLDVSSNGNSFDVEDFVEAFESRMLSHAVPEEFWTPALLSTIPLSDPATTHWAKENVLNSPWADARQALLVHYAAPELERKYNRLFLEATLEEGQSVRFFADKFMLYVRKAKLTPNSAMVRDRFLHALPQSLSSKLLLSATTCSSISELAQLALSIDSLQRSMEQFSTPVTKIVEKPKQAPMQAPKSSICELHGPCGHSTSECRAIKFRSARPSQALPRASPNPGPRRPLVAAVVQKEDFDALEDAEDAFPPVCATLQGPGPLPELIAIPVVINGIEVEAHLDTGSQVSVINNSCVSKFNLPLEPSDLALSQAQQGSTLAIQGCISNAPMEFNGVTLAQTFQVADLHSKFQVLLGLDAFKALNLFIGGISLNLPCVNDNAQDFSPPVCIEADSATTGYVKNFIAESIQANALTKGNYCSIPESVVCVNTGSHASSWVNQYSIPFALRPVVDAQVNQWLEDGVTTFSKPGCTWNSALLVVKKKSEEGQPPQFRVCLDPRHINEKLEDDKYPIPLIRTVLDRAAHSKIFTTIDLEQSYHQFFVREIDQVKTSFTWQGVQYMFRGAPFGLKTLTSIFQRVMSQLLHDLDFVIIFIDDILIFSADADLHAQHVKTVIERLTSANLTLNLKKCRFACLKVQVLGHIISEAGIELDPSKSANALDWPRPATFTEVQAFLGLANYFRDFIPAFARISRPLDELRNCPDVTSTWNDSHQMAFEAVKAALTNPPILSFPDEDLHFHVSTDASDNALGAVLFQTSDSSQAPGAGPKDKRYIKFSSRALSPAESNYGAAKRELLAIIFALTKFEDYLLGRKFTIWTDHKPLTFLLSQSRLNQLQNQWFDTLARFSFSINYLPGSLNVVPDCLSRLYPKIQSSVAKQPSITEEVCPAAPASVAALTSANSANSSPNSDPPSTQGVGLHTIAESPQASTDLASADLEVTAEIPASQAESPSTAGTLTSAQKKQILEDMHSIAHEGASRLAQRCKAESHSWAGLQEDCLDHVKSCLQCLRFNITKQGFHPATSTTSSEPMSHVAIDLAGPLPTGKGGEKFILVIIDLFTKFIFLFALKEKTAENVAHALFVTFCNFGHPKVLISDNGTEFVNETLVILQRLYSFDHRKSSPYHPQGNGSAERAVKSTLDLLRKTLDGVFGDWPAHLPSLQLRLNQRITEPLMSSPFQIMFGRMLNSFSPQEDCEFSEPAPADLQERLDLMQKIVFPALQERAAAINAARNARFNNAHSIVTFPVGGIVMAKNPVFSSKLDLRYLGPYRITAITKGGSYILADATGETLKRKFSPNLLKATTLAEPTNSHYVEKIVDSKTVKGKELYRVRWFGYTEKHDSWEPLESFGDPSIVHNFKTLSLTRRE
jgi:transposase InsO family protein